MAVFWELFGLALGFPKHVIEECRGLQMIPTLREIFMKWVEGHGVQPASLGRLVETLADLRHEHLTSQLISDFQIFFETSSKQDSSRKSIPPCLNSWNTMLL